VALLRGINVGRAKRVAMSDLRAVLEGLGYADVRTVLNSGNAVFTAREAPPPAIAKRIQAAVAERTGVSARVQVLTAETFSTVVAENCLAADANDHTRLAVSFCDDPARLAGLAPLGRRDFRPDRLALGRHAAYLWCPAGFMQSQLVEAVGRALQDSTTARNWATVLKLDAILQAGGREAGRASRPARRPGPGRRGGAHRR
jgi:uncharacterized protein (DUF1697 family)